MNLTEPPEVRDLTPDRTEELRAGLVELASRPQAPRHRWPASAPVIAAAVAVAVVAAGVVLVPRVGGPLPADTSTARPSDPATGPGTSSGTRSTPGPSERPTATTPAVVNLDRGPAGQTDARRAARACFAALQGSGESGTPAPADATTATIHWARWMEPPIGYRRDGTVDLTPGRQVVQSISTRNGYWMLCVGDGPATSWDPRTHNGQRKDNAASAARPVNVAGSVQRSVGPPWVIDSSSAFDAIPRVARVEMRLVWAGGASPWYAGYVHGGTGYVAAAVTGTHGTPPARGGVEVRAFDAAGRQFYKTTTSTF
jgi:hypothetical protein